MLKDIGFYFWPVGCGDSTSIVVNDDVVFQVDLRHLEMCDDDGDDHAPIVDKLVEHLPKKDKKPYLSAFALTHPDQDHIQGFEELLDRVTIGELWFTPRIFREYHKDLCDDAVAFKKEAERRVKKMIETGGAAAPGDRVRLIGYDQLLEEEEFEGFPTAFFTIPGNAVTMLDAEELEGSFRAFIHAPFKDDCGGDRNDTSLAMQVVLSGEPADGGVLFFGDLTYTTIRRIFDETKAADNMESLTWRVMLAAHHCSKSVMYQVEGEKEVLKKDILDDFEASQVGDGFVVASCEEIPASNSDGDNPPHAKAKARYEEICSRFLCTHEDGEAGDPLVFKWTDEGLSYDEGASASTAEDDVSKAIASARGSSAPPTAKVGFGK